MTMMIPARPKTTARALLLPVLLACVMAVVAIEAIDARDSNAQSAADATDAAAFDVAEATILEMQAALESGRVTSRELVLLHLARIAYYEDTVNAAITVSRTALAEADALDRERARYEADRQKDLLLAGAHGIAEVMEAERLDALLFPGSTGAAIGARPGYPTVVVPFGRVPNAPTPGLPSDFGAQPAPFGVSFTGTSCSEPRLIELAYAFEQATQRRVQPPSTP